MYGLTECKRVSFLPPEEIDVRPTSVGKPMDNVEVYVVDEHDQRFDPASASWSSAGRTSCRATGVSLRKPLVC